MAIIVKIIMTIIVYAKKKKICTFWMFPKLKLEI